MTFDDFSELMERGCVNGWRSSIGRDNMLMVKSVTSFLFLRRDDGDSWFFSFSYRRLGKWVTAERAIKPVNYDILDIPDIDAPYDEERQSPEARAATLSMDMLTELAENIGKV